MNNSALEQRLPSALLCIPSPALRQSATDGLAAFGFNVVFVDTPEEASLQLNTTLQDVIVVDEAFGGGDARTNPVLNELAGLPLPARRKILVALISSKVTTNSAMDTFTFSVELGVHPQDAANLGPLIGQALLRQKEFYAPLEAALKRVDEEGMR